MKDGHIKKKKKKKDLKTFNNKNRRPRKTKETIIKYLDIFLRENIYVLMSLIKI